VHQGGCPWAWPLRDREVTTLGAGAVARWLRVDEGCIWITPRLAGEHDPDIWLSAGESLALPAGSAWVVEAWPQARLSLLLDVPAAGLSRRGVERASSWAPSRLLSWLLGWWPRVA
jgi:Protein of unknown function (DUF2917)